MVIMATKTNTKYDTDKLLKIYSTDPLIRKFILTAEDRENKLLEGIPLVQGEVLFKAFINQETGLWEACIEVKHGKVTYTAYDPESYHINVTTTLNFDYVKEKENDLSDYEIEEIQRICSNTLDIDLRDLVSLKKAKKIFENDIVMKNIQLNNPTLDSASRLVIWHIRAYRKVLTNYQRDFKFLWEDTGFHSGKALAAAMRVRGFLQ